VELNRAMTNVCFKNNIKDQVTLKECSINVTWRPFVHNLFPVSSKVDQTLCWW